MRGTSFITPKNNDKISIHIQDKDLNEKLIAYGKRKNLNLSLVVTELCRSKGNIDDLIDRADREQYSMLSEEEKVDLIIRLTKSKEAETNA